MSRYLYSILSYLLLPAIVLRLYLRSLSSPAYRLRWKERFGLFTVPAPLAESQSCIWIHAVSVGEVVAAIPLIKCLQQRYPHITLVVTTMTPTGSERVTSTFGESVFHVYAPYDIPFAIKNFLARLRPGYLFIMETELWPNTILLCHKQKCKVVLVNARLSEKSARGYAKFSSLTRNMLGKLVCVIAQAQPDADRFEALGIDGNRIHIAGNLKFNIDQDAVNSTPDFEQQIEDVIGRPVLIAASTRAGEEEKILGAYIRCIETIPDLLLVLVPRHPERFDSTAELCARHSLTVVKRSSNEKLAKNSHVFLGDSMGELALYYQMSDVAFVGGSLVDTGCQNVLEPAAMGIPVLVGPSQFNFQTICQQLEQAGALITVQDEYELASKVVELLKDKQQRGEMAAAGLTVINENKGALEKTITILDKLIR